jgi:uncharacterized glyoxalase superfamily protein PhnB
MTDTRPSIYPVLQYRDAPAAMAWLEKAFGFRTVACHKSPDGKIVHAEMRFGNGMVMLGSLQDEGTFAFRTPREAGVTTQSSYIAADDIDALYERARAAGAEVTMTIRDTDYGSRDFSVRDPEGHLWSFGSYRPDFNA